jgi:hypothetical protein
MPDLLPLTAHAERAAEEGAVPTRVHCGKYLLQPDHRPAVPPAQQCHGTLVVDQRAVPPLHVTGTSEETGEDQALAHVATRYCVKQQLSAVRAIVSSAAPDPLRLITVRSPRPAVERLADGRARRC